MEWTRVGRWVSCAGAQRGAPDVCGLEDAHVLLPLGDLAVHDPRREYIPNLPPAPPLGPLHSLSAPQPALASARLYPTPRALRVHPFAARCLTQKAPSACYRFARYAEIYTSLCVQPDWALNFARKGRARGIRCGRAYRAKGKAVRTRRAWYVRRCACARWLNTTLSVRSHYFFASHLLFFLLLDDITLSPSIFICFFVFLAIFDITSVNITSVLLCFCQYELSSILADFPNFLSNFNWKFETHQVYQRISNQICIYLKQRPSDSLSTRIFLTIQGTPY